MNQKTAMTPSSQSDTQLLECLTGWGEAFGKRLESQPRWFQQLEEQLFIELHSHLPGETFADGIVDDLLDSVLQRRIEGALPAAEAPPVDPLEWRVSAANNIPEQHREALKLVVEALIGRLDSIYTDTLQRHWSKVPDGLDDADAYRTRLQALLDTHQVACAALFAATALSGQTAQGLRAGMEQFEDDWRSQSVLRALASEAERERLDRLSKKLQPDWMKGLSQAQWDTLSATQARLDDAVSMQAALMDGFATLKDYAWQRAEHYLWQHTGYRMDPERIAVHRRFVGSQGAAEPVATQSLAALVRTGPVNSREVYEVLRVEVPQRYAHAVDAKLVEQLLADLDVPADYLPALTSRYGDDEVEAVMREVYEARLQHSLLIARYAGHVEDAMADRIKATASKEGGTLHVRTLGLQAGSNWCDLLLFYRQDSNAAIGKCVLYAPGKPDGQEWVELNSLTAVTEEIVGWLGQATGRQYLVLLTPHALRAYAAELYVRVSLKASSWDASQELRGLPVGYEACLRDLIHARQNLDLGNVQRQDSPDWYRNLTVAERRLQNTDRQRAYHFEQAFDEQLSGYETYQAFLRRRVSERIGPYLKSVGVTEHVDPETVLIDYDKNDIGTRKGTMTLLELAIYGYDDNSGIDHPERGVRSSVGQNLDAVRSASLASYARSAYLGQSYVEAMTAQFLDPGASVYSDRRRAFSRMLVAILDRDLRQALGQGHLTVEVHPALVGLVSDAAVWTASETRPLGSESVADSKGAFRLTLTGVPILGVYVFRLINDREAQDWLYTPDAPDHRLLRPYADLRRGAGVVLHDYLVARATQATRERVSTFLLELASQKQHLDSLRERQRIGTWSDQFDVYVRHGLDEVSQLSKTRSQVIESHVLKGAVFFALPLAVVCPPFALLMDALFFVAGLRTAIVSHTKGDTQKALLGWLEASWALLGLGLTGRQAVLGGRRLSSLKAEQGAKAASQDALGVDTRWAVEQRPAGLKVESAEGIWKGTQVAADGKHYVRYRGRYYRVERQGSEDVLRVVNAKRPDAVYKLPVRVAADASLQPASPGLRGGNRMEEGGWVDSLAQVVPGLRRPAVAQGALQGEGVVARFAEGAATDYLYTLNLQSCVGVALYNQASRMGAILHIDHGAKPYIRPLIDNALKKLRQSDPEGRITSVMAGGDWLMSSNIGKPVRELLRAQGLEPTWQHWSFSAWLGGKTYGMTLNLQSGRTRVYQTPQALAQELYLGLHGRLSKAYGGPSGSPLEPDVMLDRMLRFMRRVSPEQTRRLLPHAPAATGDPKSFGLLDLTRQST